MRRSTKAALTVATVGAAITAGATAQLAQASDVGRTHSIAGFDSGERAAVTIVTTRFFGRDFMTPSGKIRFAVLVRFRNSGRTVLDDCGDNDVQLIGRSGAQFEVDTDGPDPWIGCWKIRPGGVRMGWVAFDVPRYWRSYGAQIQVGLDSGMADDFATWRL
jgi:hypothetical protein